MAKNLSDFIRSDLAPILDAWEKFVRTIPSGRRLDAEASRDHASGILQAIAADLDRAQTPLEQAEKSQGRGPKAAAASEAALHGAERAAEGFSINEGLSEFRALRASVLQLWRTSNPDAPPVVNEELVRFNEAIDQAVAESVARFASDRAYAENIERSANFDELTGLPNRRVFRDRIQQDLMRSQRAGLAMALMNMDLDGFKDVNDRLGHAAGDELLQQVAQRLTGCVRRTDTVARIGGDEFAIIIPELDRAPQVEVLAQKMLDRLTEPFVIQDETVEVSGSIGITLFPLHASTPEDLMRNADQAMYTAKKAGRNRFSFYTSGMRDAAWARSKLRDELRVALREHQLLLYYQPIVDLALGGIVKAEALLRWQHPEAGLMLPVHFLGLAEETGLIAQIDAWVLDQAARRAAQWSRLLGVAFQVSINNSAVEFVGHEPMKSWDAYLVGRGGGGEGISVEVPEAVVSNASPAVAERIKALRRAGVQLTVDRFGTGCSSMASLKHLEVDSLKIDQSFVRAQAQDSRTIVEAAIAMGHTLGLKVIAEGVETAEQRDWLKGAGCDYGQGHFFSHPVPAAEFRGLLKAGNVLPPSPGLHA